MTRNAVVLALTLAGLPGVAFGVGGEGAILKGSPLEQFSAADYRQFFAAAQQAADGALGVVIDWSTGAGRTHGTVQAVAGFKRGDTRCRELQGLVTAGERDDPFRITYCKAGEGRWRLAPNRPRRKSVPPVPSRETAR